MLECSLNSRWPVIQGKPIDNRDPHTEDCEAECQTDSEAKLGQDRLGEEEGQNVANTAQYDGPEERKEYES